MTTETEVARDEWANFAPSGKLRWRKAKAWDGTVVRSPGYPECGDTMLVLEMEWKDRDGYVIWREVEIERE